MSHREEKRMEGGRLSLCFPSWPPILVTDHRRSDLQARPPSGRVPVPVLRPAGQSPVRVVASPAQLAAPQRSKASKPRGLCGIKPPPAQPPGGPGEAAVARCPPRVGPGPAPGCERQRQRCLPPSHPTQCSLWLWAAAARRTRSR